MTKRSENYTVKVVGTEPTMVIGVIPELMRDYNRLCEEIAKELRDVADTQYVSASPIWVYVKDDVDPEEMVRVIKNRLEAR